MLLNDLRFLIAGILVVESVGDALWFCFLV